MALIGHKNGTQDMMVWAQMEERVESLKTALCSLHCFDEGHLVFINLLFVNGKGKTT